VSGADQSDLRAASIARYVEDATALLASPSDVAAASGLLPEYRRALPRVTAWAFIRARVKASAGLYAALQGLMHRVRAVGR